MGMKRILIIPPRITALNRPSIMLRLILTTAPVTSSNRSATITPAWDMITMPCSRADTMRMRVTA